LARYLLPFTCQRVCKGCQPSWHVGMCWGHMRLWGACSHMRPLSVGHRGEHLTVYQRCRLLYLGEFRMLFVCCYTLLSWTVYSPPSFYTFALTVDRHHSLSPCAHCRAHRKPLSYLHLIHHLAPARDALNQRPFSIFPSARSSSQVAHYTYDSLSRAVEATSAVLAALKWLQVVRSPLASHTHAIK